MGHITTERDGSIAILRLARPPANAVDLELAAEMEAAFVALTSTSGVAAVVITGSGRFFSAGLDLKRVPLYGHDEQRAMVGTANRLLGKLYSCPLPVVAAVNGHAVAAGLILALTCDYRVGTNGACKLGLTEARVGIPFPVVAMLVLQAEVAPDVARVLTLRANNIDPQSALAWGVLDELQAPAHVLSTAIEVAGDLASHPTAGYARIKQQLRSRTLAFIEETNARANDPALESWVTSGAGAASAALLRRGR